jgi:hypothetical protein
VEYELKLNGLSMTAEEALNELSGIKMVSYNVGKTVIDKVTKVNEKQIRCRTNSCYIYCVAFKDIMH